MATHSRRIIFWIVFCGILVGSIIYGHELINGAVKRTISIALKSINKKKELRVSVEEVGLNVTTGTIFLKGIKLAPDHGYFRRFTEGGIPKKMLTEVEISKVELTGVGIKDLFWDRRVDAETFLVENLKTTLYLRKDKSMSKKKNSRTGILDSLHLKGLSSIDLGAIKVKNYQLSILESATKDTLTSFSGDDLVLSGIDLEKRDNGTDLFELKTENFGISLKNQRLRLNKNEHEITLGSLKLRNAARTLNITDFRYRPIKGLEHLASKKRFADNLFDISFKDLTIEALEITETAGDYLGSMGNVLINGMDIKILKNKQKPENTLKRPLLPQQSLKKLAYPIHIGHFAIINSALSYREIQLKHMDNPLEVNLTHLNLKIDYITSIKDSLVSDKPLKIALNSNLMGKIPLNLMVNMPYDRHNDSFHYSGAIGSANLAVFNQLLTPVTGIDIQKGKLKSIHFSVDATPYQADGELTMLYSDLSVHIPRKHKGMEHALSFLASTAIHSNNPKKNGKLRVSRVFYNRPPYKGLGGFINKSIISGVINSVQPLGKNKKLLKTK